MILKNHKIVDRLPEGEYAGIIKSCIISTCGKYMWFKIDIENSVILNINIPFQSKVYCDFAECFTDKNGEYDTDDFINTEIYFSLVDRNINGNIYSKFKSLEIKQAD